MNRNKLRADDCTNELIKRYFNYLEQMGRVNFNSLNDPMKDDQIEGLPSMDQEWEEMMVAGPSSINFIGAVMVISSIKDFPLRSDFKYKLIQYPKSFATTLVQIANEMSRALFGAHTSMDKIQAHMRQLPTLIKTALKLITQAGLPMTKAMLPRTLSNIGRYANQSAAFARESLDRFINLGELLNEVVEASTYTNSQNKELAEKLQLETELAKNNRTQMDIVVQKIESEYEISKQNLEKAREEYRLAMKSIPGGEWDAHAWYVYASALPAETCTRNWIGQRSCRSNRDYQFNQYSAEAKWKASQALVV